jgi:hypothetical protein
MKINLLLSRLRVLSASQFIQCLRPVPVNVLLYRGTESPESSFCQSPSVYIESFSLDHPSGREEIDKRLTAYNIAYVAFISGEIAHESWVFFDTLLPSQYGFDPSFPVIGNSYTADRFRRQGLFSESLRYILKDLRDRSISRNVYILTSPTVLASSRAIEKAGYELIAQLRGTRVFGVFIYNKSLKMVA